MCVSVCVCVMWKIESMFGAVQFLNVLILTFLLFNLFNSVKVTEFPTVWERTSYSCLNKFCCYITNTLSSAATAISTSS